MPKPLSIRQVPLLYPAAALLLSIWTYSLVEPISQYAIYLCLGVAVMLIFARRTANPSVLYIYSALLFLGMYTLGIFYQHNRLRTNQLKKLPSNIISNYHRYTGEVTEVRNSAKYRNVTVLLKTIESAEKKIELPHQQVLIKTKLDSSTNLPILQLGETVQFSSRFINVDSEESNSYYQYLQAGGYQYVGYVSPAFINGTGNSSYAIWKSIRYKVRSAGLQTISKYITDPQRAAILKALLLGYKSELDNDTRRAFVNSGTMHILAVSGLHVGIVATIIHYLFKSISIFVFLSPQFKTYTTIALLIGFAELSGGAAPVWRAVVMASIYYYAKLHSLPTFSLNLIALAAIVLLLYNPQSLHQLSFQLSFCAVIGIILTLPILQSIFYPENWFMKKLLDIIYMGVAAQLFLFPLSLYYFGQFSWLSPITSTAAIPTGFLLIVLGFTLLFFNDWMPIISHKVGELLEYFTGLFFDVSAYGSTIEHGVINYSDLSLATTVALLLTVFSVVLFLRIKISKPLI